MKVLVVGANGQIGKLAVDLLKEKEEHSPVAMIRKEEQVAQFEDKGIETTLVDLEGPVEEIEQAMTDIDAVIFTAGSGGSTGYDKTLLIDLDGAVKVIEAAKKKGIERFLMVSAFQANRRDHWSEDIKPYYVAKHYADIYLQASELNYTIVRPGNLTNDARTGKVRIEKDIQSGTNFEIPRADVAEVLIQALDNEKVYNQSFDLVSGDQTIEEALKAF